MKRKNRKLVLWFVLCAICSVLFFRIDVNAATIAEGKAGENIQYTLSDDGTLTITGSGEMYGYSELKNMVSGHQDQIKRVVIKSGVENIGSGAFENCGNLKEISIAGTVREILSRAFIGCSGLEKVNLPSSIEKIGGGAFYECTSLTTINIPKNVKEYDGISFDYSWNDSPFYGCTNLRDVDIQNDMIFDREFCESGLTEITIPSNVKSIGINAFSTCKKLEKVVIGDGVESIGDCAFEQCDRLNYVKIGSHVTAIPNEAFDDDANLKTVDIPSNVKKIDTYAFRNCGLEEVTFQEGLEKIGTEAFVDCNHLLEIQIPRSVTKIDSLALGYCDAKFVSEISSQRSGTLVQGFVISGYQNTEAQVYADNNRITFHALDKRGKSAEDLNYAFSNSSQSFGYENNYKIPYERYKAIFGDTTRAKSLYASSDAWGGNCYGMSSTSGMFNQLSSGVKVQNYRADSARVSDLKVGDIYNKLSVREFIETMQVSQFDRVIQSDYQNNGKKLTELYDAVKKETEQDNPVIIAVGGAEGGHAILAYRTEELEGNNRRIYVYDCNYPNDYGRYLELSVGNLESWRYHFNEYDKSESGYWGSGKTKAWISYIPFSDYYQVWSNRNDRSVGSCLLTFDCENATIKDSNQKIVATVRDGTVVDAKNNIYEMVNLGICFEDGKVKQMPNEKIVLVVPDNKYSVTSDDNKEFEASLTDNDLGVNATIVGGTATFTVDDETKTGVVVAGADTVIGSTMKIGLSSTMAGIQSVTVAGSSVGSAVTIVQSKGKLDLDNTEKFKVAIDDKEISGSDDSEKFISLNTKAITLQKKQVTTKVTVKKAEKDKIAAVSSSDKKIVGVSIKDASKGKLSIKAGTKTGKATVTIRLESGLSAKLSVRVQSGKVKTTKITLAKKTVTLKVKKTYKIQSNVAPITTQEKVTYVSSNKKLATVSSSGVVKAKKKGTVKIKVRSGKKVVTLTVKIK